MSDLISRQAAIEALTALEEPAPTARHLIAIYDCEDAIKALPSAQPDPIKINTEDFNKEDWERLKKEWGNTPITVLPSAQETHEELTDCSK